MLVRLTNRCSMQCRHCMVGAQPNGQDHMSVETFRKAVRFAQQHDLGLLMLSGGEPTEHPDILRLLEVAVFSVPMPHITLLTNGLFLNANTTELRRRRELIIDSCDAVQVTNDPRYYPVHVEDPDRKKVVFERSIRQVIPMGRAVQNGLKSNRTSPCCFNLRSAVRALGDFDQALLVLRGKSYFCTPSINHDGTIVAGEAPMCAPIGTVDSTGPELVDAIRSLRCRSCGLFSGLSAHHIQAIEDP